MVKPKWATFLLAGAALAVLGCDPTVLPEPSGGDPVFRLEGNLDSTTFDLAAGVEGYFMFTELVPTNDGNLLSINRLEELGCSTACAPGWQFEFNGSAATLDSLLAPGPIPFLQQGTTTVDTIYRLNLAADVMHTDGLGAEQYNWIFFDGSTAGNPEVQKTLPGPGIYQVELETITEDGCTSYTRKTFSTLENLPGCEVRFLVDTTTAFDSLITAYYQPGPVQPLNLVWQDSIEGETINFFFQQQGQSIDLCLEGIFEQGCTAVSCQTIIIPQGELPGSVCSNSIAGGVEMVTDSVTVPGPTSGIVLRYVDEQGFVYSTASGPQPGLSQFVIEAAEPYLRNNLEQATRQLNIRFECQLYDAQGQPWKQVQGMGVIAAAIPE